MLRSSALTALRSCRQSVPAAQRSAPTSASTSAVAAAPWCRGFRTSPAAAAAPVPSSPRSRSDARARYAIGPFTPLSAGLFVLTGVGLLLYFRSEKQAVEERRKAENASAKVGRPRIGGEFELVMPVAPSGSAPGTIAAQVEGRKVTHEDLKGAWTLVYFGFTNCPDICPEELDKMGKVVDAIDASFGQIVNPLFITCDPARDTLAATATYVSEFHPRLMGLTGSYEAVKQACKAYRVYFSTPPGADPSGDYLVDHSIFFYLMDPEGKFVDAFGRSQSADDVTGKVHGFVESWKKAGHPLGNADAKARITADSSRRVP